MAGQATERFMRALEEAERSKQVDALVALFTDDAELSRATKQGHERHGRDGVRAFWQEYLATFDEVSSHWTRVIASEDAAALEWHAEGKLRGGAPIHYDGVTLLELDDAHERVRRCRTYFDARPFLQHHPAGQPRDLSARPGAG